MTRHTWSCLGALLHNRRMSGAVTATTRAQRATWARGEFHRIGVSQLIVGELLERDLQVVAVKDR